MKSNAMKAVKTLAAATILGTAVSACTEGGVQGGMHPGAVQPQVSSCQDIHDPRIAASISQIRQPTVYERYLLEGLRMQLVNTLRQQGFHNHANRLQSIPFITFETNDNRLTGYTDERSLFINTNRISNKVILHELDHSVMGDTYNGKTCQQIEAMENRAESFANRVTGGYSQANPPIRVAMNGASAPQPFRRP